MEVAENIELGAEEPDASSTSDDEEEPKERPYNALLQLLGANANSDGHARKRRKLKHREREQKEEKFEVEEEALDVQDDLAEAEAEDEEEEEDASEEESGDEDVDNGVFYDICDRYGQCADILFYSEFDPFETHFAHAKEAELGQKIEKASQKWSTTKSEIAGGLRVATSYPDTEDSTSLLSTPRSVKDLMVGDETTYSPNITLC